jgi:hypothetical protein
MNEDGTSYLDLADRLLHRDFAALANHFWSPLYPCLLASALKVFSPTPTRELAVVHVANCIIGLIALASFTFFVRQWLPLQTDASKYANSVGSFRARTGLAYALFLWGTIEMIGLDLVTPDLCVAAFIYLAAGLCCRLVGPSGGRHTGALLGLALSGGYFAKAPMLPLGLVLLVLLAMPWFVNPPRRSSLAIAAVIFVIIVGPYVLVLSSPEHHLTFGESGRLNYAWHVQKTIPIYAGWIGQPQGTGTPLHPPRVLSREPTVLEFKDTVPGTYPLWYDPGFFHEGLQVRFDLRKQIVTLMGSSRRFLGAHGSTLSPLLAGFCVLCSFVAFKHRFGVTFSHSWLILWSLVAFSMFAIVLIEARYISAFLVLFWIAVYDALSPGRLGSARRAVISVTAVCIFLSQLIHLGLATAQSVGAPKVPRQVVVSNELGGLGLRAGDEIATVGYPFDVYYARLARLRVIANIGFNGDRGPYEVDKFWELSDSKFNALKKELRGIGVKAIVSPDKCVVTSSNGWHSIGNTGYCVQLLE